MEPALYRTAPLGVCNSSFAGKVPEMWPETLQSLRSSAKAAHFCACRSPSSQLRAAAVLNSAPPTEEPTSKADAAPHSFNPLLLIASHSTIPEPLKFLWTNKKTEPASETRDEFEPTYSPVNSQADCESLLIGPQGITEEELTHLGCNLLEEPGNAADVASSEHNDNAVAPSNAANDAALPPVLGYLIPKIVALLPDLKYFKTETVPNNTFPSNQTNSSSDPSCAVPEDVGQTSLSSQNDKGGVACTSAVVPECSLEAPYVRVAHTKESFSKFLRETSLYDMKVFTQMAFLCDMAYMIPSIQPSQLIKYHRLRLVTTSLSKKADAESKALKMMPRSDTELDSSHMGNGCAYSQSEHTSRLKEAQFKECALQSSNEHVNSAQHLKSMIPDNAYLSEENGPSFDFHAASSEEQEDPIMTRPYAMEREEQEALVAIAAQVTAGAIANEETNLTVGKDLSTAGICPCEWFVCDEQNTHTRLFVIQGSESLASWQTNLFFEPTQFEGLDVSVHRGIYDAARALFDQVLPEVIDHISRHGDLAQVRFTGHSLGGSLAVLLALMLQIRGVLPRSGILPVVTFGSPFIMCRGDYLLKKLQLPVNHIQAVIMHRDIVPRAFACDYPDHVAEVLRRLNGRFRDHSCLTDQKLLYAPMGQLYILQPLARTAPLHPLLPDSHGLYMLKHPLNGRESEKASELRAAQRAFLNLPHPLDILSDRAAYGFDGTISRDHDPRSYTKAIQAVLKHTLKRLRLANREHRRRVIWPAVIMASSTNPLKNRVFGASGRRNVTTRSVVSRASSIFRQRLNNPASNGLGFLLGNLSFWLPHRSASGRHARGVTVQRVQMGMLIAMSMHRVILEYLSSFSVYV